MPFEHRIGGVEALRELYARPHRNVVAKAIDHIDEAATAFLARSTFAVLATSGPRGGDASPRGGPPGFAAVLDPRRLALGDLVGNRRLDSFENLLANPRVGLLFVIPGMSESLRVNRRACLTTDPAVLDACVYDGTQPKVALGIDVDEVYLHCAKAFRRGGVWDPATWPAPDDRPTPGEIYRAHLALDVPPEVIDADLEAGYAASMWQPGGGDAAASA
jgi:PPOX class probable FMN-dependent enzyme